MSVTIALSKGRLADDTVEILESIGVDCSALKVKSRKLIFEDATGTFKFIYVKPTDVPTYVEHGVADMGVCGKDTILESESNIYELLDLQLAKCKLAIAGYPNTDFLNRNNLRVATKYVNCAKQYFSEKQQNIEIIKLNGSVELGPVIGLSDVILDIVESGKTLIENDLTVLEDIAPISARLVVNKVSLKTKRAIINPLVASIKKYLENNND